VDRPVRELRGRQMCRYAGEFTVDSLSGWNGTGDMLRALLLS
jgi:hypothetical protein